MQATTVYLALGSNLGDRRANLVAALERLREHVVVEAVSSIYETEPAYVLDQPRFLNAALCGRTTLSPIELLAFVKGIERALGRTDGPRERLVDARAPAAGGGVVREALVRPEHRPEEALPELGVAAGRGEDEAEELLARGASGTLGDELV